MKVLLQIVAVILVIVLLYKLYNQSDSFGSVNGQINSESVYINGNNKWINRGCFKDDGTRTIPINIPNIIGAEQCSSVASSAGSNVFGLQYGGECFIGKNAPYDRLGAAPGPCNPLGDSWVNNVYTLEEPEQKVITQKEYKHNIEELLSSFENELAKRNSCNVNTKPFERKRVYSKTQ